MNYELNKNKFEKIKREELERLVGRYRVNIFYDIVDMITSLIKYYQKQKNLKFIER